MIAKLIVHGVDREHARRRMLRALDEFVIEGPKTLLGFHKALLAHECFVRGETCHGLVESSELAAQRGGARRRSTLGNSLSHGAVDPSSGRAPSRSTGGGSRCASLEPEQPWRELARRRARARGAAAARGGSDAIVSPMQGTVLVGRRRRRRHGRGGRRCSASSRR